jgi:hypothetical protein
MTCPACHQVIDATDYFCRNCGKNIRSRPLSTSIPTQLWLYLKTLLFPPFGFIWGFRYLFQPKTSAKLIGLFVILLTIVETIWLIQTTTTTINNVTTEINRQLNMSL